jgi:hypothetical protein
LGLPPDFGEFLIAGAKDVVRSDHWQEMESLSRLLDLPVRDVVLCNLYYEALKVILSRVVGCTHSQLTRLAAFSTPATSIGGPRTLPSRGTRRHLTS